MDAPRLRVDDFDYDLPQGAIAQTPAEPRDASRLLILHRRSGALEHARFGEIGRWLAPRDLLVVNDSRVIPARLRGKRPSGGAAEILVLRPIGDGRWEALVRPSRRLAQGSMVVLRGGHAIEVGERLGDGTRAIRFSGDPDEVMAVAGEMPLPPYITEPLADPARYQTIYARLAGSAAAPTAGLHFTHELWDRVAARHEIVPVTLDVGLDTFRPLQTEVVEEHPIHSERYSVPAATAEAVERALADGRRVVAVGTTTVRVLETVFADPRGALEGRTRLLITPGHEFRAVGGLVTNFHLPRSSLLALVMAFAGRERTRDLYRTAVNERYRFYSFGDATLIL